MDLPPGFHNLPSRGHGSWAGLLESDWACPLPLPITKSRGLKRPRSKKVTWAEGSKLCRVRLFSSEDAPYLAGVDQQDRLNAKMSKSVHASSVPMSMGNPPSFLTRPGAKRVPGRLVDDAAIDAVVPTVAWRRPPAFKPDVQASWSSVGAGEESSEVAVQHARQIRVLEAVYPRSSSIPSSPAEPAEAQNSLQDDVIPVIPVMPLAEDVAEPNKAAAYSHVSDLSVGGQGCSFQQAPSAFPHPHASAACSALPSVSTSLFNLPTASHQQETIAAASAASSISSVVAEAVKKSKEAGSLIDSELLFRILQNPSLLDTLKNSSFNRVCAVSNNTIVASNFSQSPPIAASTHLCVTGLQESRVDLRHSAPAFVQHPSFPPNAYCAQMQGWPTATNWR